MTVRSVLSWAAAVGLSVASIQAKEPTRSKPAETPVSQSVPNQQLADGVAAYLHRSGLGNGASLQISTKDGSVELSGTVSSTAHGDAVIKTVMEVPGVTRVIDSLEVKQVPITRVSAAEPQMIPNFGNPQMPQQGMMPQPMGIAPAMMGGPLPAEPAPVGAPGSGQYDQYGPKLPPYSWPTYAPYPNLSRVAYPQAYPYNAFPYIGPYYPYPKVPLGWRSVKLEWEDGHWYFGKVATPHDYWRVRMW